ncbi:MAG: cell division protein ZapA [Paracoccaceae bacterium]
MPEVKIDIGGYKYQVACETGEEVQLQAAAKLLVDEAETLQSQIGRVAEPRMLLMSGLMLADRFMEMEQALRTCADHISGLEDKLRTSEARASSLAATAPKVFPNEEVLLRSYEDAVLRMEELAAELEKA